MPFWWLARHGRLDGNSQTLSELYETLDHEPSNIFLHEMILDMWINRGEEEVAKGVAATLLQLDPSNAKAKKCLGETSEQTRPTRAPRAAAQDRQMSYIKSTPHEGNEEIATKIEILKTQAARLRKDVSAVSVLAGIPTNDEMMERLEAIGRGETIICQPPSARELARAVMESPDSAQRLIVEDFESAIQWAQGSTPPLTTDEVRQKIVKRKTLLRAALPVEFEDVVDAAMKRVERDHLKKKYQNDTTMTGGESIEEIPPENFLVTEDNYAWDMEELAQAIRSGEGVMRNPLSKQMFTETDIRLILAHPLGQPLRPLQVAQDQMRKGVRPATIMEIRKLGTSLLNDQSPDGYSSRCSIDEFLAFVATLPAAEQTTINSLKIPAVDSHTRQPYDYSVGDSVRDGKANVTCSHKIGDFLCQAATYLELQ